MSKSLPSKWKTCKFTDIAQINPRRPSELSEFPADYPVTFVPMSCVSEKSGSIAEVIEKPLSEVKKGFTYFAENDVIFAKITPCMQNGKSAIARNLKNGLGFGSTEFHVIRPTAEVFPEWLYYFVRQQSFLDEAKSHFRGSAGQQRVPSEFISEHKIPLPPLVEQRHIIGRIKECLSRVDEIKRLREDAQQEAEAIFASALSGYVSTDWPLKTLGSVAVEIRNGWSGKETIVGVRAKVLRLSSVHSRTIDPSESKQVVVSESARQDFRVVKGDVFIVRGNGSKHLVGRSAMAAETYDDVIFSDLLIRVRFNSAALPKFVHYVLHSPSLRRQIEEKAKTAAGIWKVNQTHLNGLEIPCPDIPQQTAFIEKVEQTADVCRQLLTEVNGKEVELISQAVLRKAFAGEL